MGVGGFVQRLKFWKRGVINPDSTDQLSQSLQFQVAHRLKRYDKYVTHIQSLVMWEDPTASVMCIIFINLLFWLFVSLEWRFYGIVSLVLLVMCVHDLWTGLVWPEISVPNNSAPPPDLPASPSVVQISKTVSSFWEFFKFYALWLQNLRVHHHGKFCCLVSVACCLLWLIGSTVSGLLLSYLLLMTALLVPGTLQYCVSPQLKDTVAAHFCCIQQAFTKYTVHDSSDDEYIPVTTSEDIALLTRVSDFHHDTYDSITNPGTSSDIVSGIGLMPSHEEDSLATLSDLEPASMLPLDPEDDSDNSQDDHQIQFQSGHFNGDSSSDEEAFTRDLEFSGVADERDFAATRGISSFITQAVTSNVIGSVNLLANVIRNRQVSGSSSQTDRQPLISRTNSESENDDFEIINREELNSQ